MILSLHKSLKLQPIKESDAALLCKIYSSTRTEELAVTNWPAPQIEMFLLQQFTAQHHWYKNNYRGANFWLIMRNSEAIGRLYVHEDYEGSVRVIDITLLPEYRGKGLGSSIIKDVIAFGDSINKPVTIHVEAFNPAKKLYEKLGFKKVYETNEVYHLMERTTNQKAMAI